MYLYVNEQSCIYMLRVSILLLTTRFLFDFGTVSTVWYFLFSMLLASVKYSSNITLDQG